MINLSQSLRCYTGPIKPSVRAIIGFMIRGSACSKGAAEFQKMEREEEVIRTVGFQRLEREEVIRAVEFQRLERDEVIRGIEFQRLESEEEVIYTEQRL